jgi:5S rRNA maturation endonuclease (ribonuclease M5)
MGESNETWGDFASHDQALADVWDSYDRLPEPGEHRALDAFCERKHITIRGLMRVGAKLAGDNVLAFSFPRGLKFRDIVTDRRWAYEGSDWTNLRIVPQGEARDTAIVVEGETDGAFCTENYDADVAIMPAGANYFPESYATQLSAYKIVLVGLDQDEAGERGAATIIERLPNAMRFVPPGNDWCASDGALPPLPTELPERQEAKKFVSAGEIVTMEVPEVVSWFEHGILPIGGLLILHGWIKGYKSFAVLDMLAAIAQGQDWATFEPMEEPAKVCMFQWEITWPWYQKRIIKMREFARERALFDENFFTYTPTTKPRIPIGNQKAEDQIVKDLQDAGIQVVCIDPIRRAIGAVDLNSEKEVQPLLAFFEKLNREGITVVATHHDRKSAGERGGGDPIGMTGSGAFGGNPDTLVSVEVPRGHDWRESPQRNLFFVLRNDQVGPKGMEFMPNESLMYSTEMHGQQAEDDGTNDPPI